MEEEKLIISINEARKQLGGKAKNLSDAQVEELIIQLDFIAGMAINRFKDSGSKIHDGLLHNVSE